MSVLSLLDSDDVLGEMLQLPAFPQRPPWVTSPTDCALGNWVVALIEDRERSPADARHRCVRAALAAVKVAAPHLPPDSEDSALTRHWLDTQLLAIERWLSNPSRTAQESARASYDPTRQTTAWHDFDVVDAWIAESADFAIHAVWSGDLDGYITPPLPPTCASLSAICAARALRCDGVDPRASVLAVANALKRM